MITSLQRLVDALNRLPSVGKKSAWRLALHLMERPAEEVQELADCLITIKKTIVRCRECGNYAEAPVCTICSSPGRDRAVICVVEKPIDILTIENSGRYRGVYHVLGGVLSPISGMTADKLRVADLSRRIDETAPRELLLGLGAGAEAETTVLYLARLFGARGLRITRLARGLPAGMDLEYVDQITLTQALNERIDIRYE